MSGPVLCVRLDAGYGATHVLHGIEFDLNAGECLGLIGTSGAGKSTLVHALLGLAAWRGGWARGEVTVDGRNLLALSRSERRKLLGRAIALVPQSPTAALNPLLSLRRHFVEAWCAHGREKAELGRRLDELAEKMELPKSDSFWDRKPGQVSVGQAQRVALALALLHGPSLLIADEPTSALDPITQVEVLRTLRCVVEQERVGMLYISHDITSVLQLCDRVACLAAGRLTGCTAVDSLRDEPRAPELEASLRALPVPLNVLLDHLRPQSNQSA